MREATRIRLANWTTLIQARCESGLTVDEWCAQNNVTRDAYYYWLKKVRKQALLSVQTSNALVATDDYETSDFVRLPDNTAAQQEGATMRIRLGKAVIEVSNDASADILAFLKEVMRNAY